MTLISKVMVENDRLQDIRSELESRVESPEQMESFMRKIIPLLDGFERIMNLALQYPPSKRAGQLASKCGDNLFSTFEYIGKIWIKTT